VEANETTRQRLVRWLANGAYDFDQLREVLQISVRDLEDELRHVERSLRGQGRRLLIAPPECRDCGFTFPGRRSRHLHTPGRCPRCRGERVDAAQFRIAD
jgi:predicted Zn-ribbon and HTH transcriptional regulator